jgi:RimJ/RimL family protein N-acetyltransferase
VTIRRAVSADAPLILNVLNAICAEGGAFYVTQFVPDGQWQPVLRNPAAHPDHLLLVAEGDSQLIGVLNLFPEPGHTLSHHVAELGIAVAPTHRRRGIGRSMMEHALAWAEQTALEKVVLRVFATNLPALALYTHFGFHIEGRQQRQIRTSFVDIDLVWMARFLR